MKAGRGIQSLGWAALVFGVACSSLSWAADGDPMQPPSFTTGSTNLISAIRSSPVLDKDDNIYVCASISTSPPTGRVFAFSPDFRSKDGWPVEGIQLPDYIESSPAIGADGTLYVGCVDGYLYALQGGRGQLPKWRYLLGTYSSSSPAIGADGTIYIGSGGANGDNISGENGLHAVYPDGTRRWDFPTGGNVESAPAIGSDGTLYFGSEDKFIYAVNPDGSLKWKRETGYYVNASPAIGSDGTVYLGSLDGWMYAYRPDGELKWKRDIGAAIWASVALGADDTLYFGAMDGNFYALKPERGEPKWDGPLGVGAGIVSSAAVRGDGTIVFGTNNGVLWAIQSRDASRVWSRTLTKAGAKIQSSPVILRQDGGIFVGASDGKLYALEGSAQMSSYSKWPMFHGNSAHTGRAVGPTGGRLINLSTRAQAGVGSTLIAGFVANGPAKNYLIRGVGPSLLDKGVANPLPNPSLVVRSNGSPVALFSNDDWGTAANRDQIVQTSPAVGAFALPEGSRDAVVLGAVEGGLYTAELQGGAGESGVALIELYDTNPADQRSRLVNVSTRTAVGTEDQALFAGFVTEGSEPVRLLIRAVGPGLAGFGVPNILARPSMTVYDSRSEIALNNEGWSNSKFRGDAAGAAIAVGAFELAENSADCAAVVSLPPGAYTISVKGVNRTTGEALIEVYLLP